MSKNSIQFQPGLSLKEFLSQYGQEEQCEKAAFNWRWPQGFKCPKCGCGHFCVLKSRVLFQSILWTLSGSDSSVVTESLISVHDFFITHG